MAVAAPPQNQGQNKRNADDSHNPSIDDYERKFTDPSSTAHDLKQLEDYANDAGSNNFDDIENYANDPKNATGTLGGIDAAEKYANDPAHAVREAEERNNPNWKNNFSGNKETEQNFMGKFKGFAQKKGPAGLIIGLLMGGGLLGGGLFAPALGLMHIKSIAADKLEKLGPMLEERTEQSEVLAIFSDKPTSATCVIKVKCRFKGLTDTQMKALTEQGAQVLDKDGKPVTKNPITRTYTGGKTLVLSDGTKFDAQGFKKAIRDPSSGGKLRSTMRGMISPRFVANNDPKAKAVRAEKKLVSNPKWGEEGDKNAAGKEIAKAVAGESVSAAADENTKYTTDEKGNKVPAPQDPGAQGVDLGGDAEDINTEAAKQKADALAGKPVPEIPQDTIGAAQMPEYEGSAGAVKKGIKAIAGFLNPADVAVGMCTAYQLTTAVVLTAQLIGIVNAMRYASQFLSTADKFFAGFGTGDEMEKAMGILEEADDKGDAFGDSFSYQYIAYGKVTSIPLQSSAMGNDVIRTMAASLNAINSIFPGGRATVRTLCNIITNPITQVGLILTNFIPGSSVLTSTLTKVVAKGGKEFVLGLIKDQIKKVTEAVTKNLSKDALKDAAKSAGQGILNLAKKPSTAVFVALYFAARYGVPFIAQTIAGTEFQAADGVKAMDGIGNGTDGITGANAAAHGAAPLDNGEASQFLSFVNHSNDQYVADMRKEAAPLDFNNPYSTGSTLVGAAYPLLSHFNIKNMSAAKILSLPGEILSSLNPSKLLGKTAYAEENDIQDSLAYCNDDYKREQNVATSVWCNNIYGARDMNILRNMNQEQIIDRMLQKKAIDEEGNPAPDSDYSKYAAKCLDGSENKAINENVETEEELDPECYNEKDKTEEHNIYRTYYLDEKGIYDNRDGIKQGGGGSSGGSAAALPEECKTMAASDAGQIACHAYQFDPYGYLMGGGHGGTAQEFMTKFKAGGFTAGKDHILDCSGLVRMAIFDATGTDIGGMGTNDYPGSGKFTEVPKDQAKPGDLIWKNGHVEIIVKNDTGAKKFETFGAHDVYSDINKDIGPSSYSYDSEYVNKVLRLNR